MGNKQQSQKSLKPANSTKKVTKILGEAAFQSLQNDWAKVKNLPVDKVNWSNTSVNLAEFKSLMNPQMRAKDVEALFNLYDCDHDGTITWKEYIIVITLIMAGSVKEKIQLIFNCFDDDGNGVLSKEEFVTAATRFSQNEKDPQAIVAYATSVFVSCDKNSDGSVSYKEFQGWVSENPAEFERFAGVLNILHDEDD